ncbi:CE1759 family FMN reductase [Longispora urticae]
MTSYRLAVVSAGASDPSSTRMLADRISQRVTALAGRRGHDTAVTVVDLRELASEVTAALVSRIQGPKLRQAVATLADADGIVVSTPVYAAGASGLLTSFFQILDSDLLIARPVIVAATAGTARHSLVVDEQLRSLFAYLRALTVPTSVFAAPEDWNAPELGRRLDRAAFELVLLMESGFARAVRDESWHAYQHEFGGAGGTEVSIDLGSDLMRLATGGSARVSGGGDGLPAVPSSA